MENTKEDSPNNQKESLTFFFNNILLSNAPNEIPNSNTTYGAKELLTAKYIPNVLNNILYRMPAVARPVIIYFKLFNDSISSPIH